MSLFLDKVFGDRGRTFSDSFCCPFMLCPSNQPISGAKKPSMKFVQRIAPRVYQYRCRHCFCLINKGEEGPAVPEDRWAQNMNPKLIGSNPSFNLRHW